MKSNVTDPALNSRRYAEDLDQADPLKRFRHEFHIPLRSSGEPQVYLAGNSLGLQPKRTATLIHDELKKWRSLAVRAHVEGPFPWLPYHEFLAEPMANIVGGTVNEVVAMNSLTTNLHLMLATFYRPTQDRHKILLEERAFPSDHFAVESQIRWHDFIPESSMVVWRPRPGEELLRLEDFAELIERHQHELALVILPGIHFYTGQLLPIMELTALAQTFGLTIGFDLAHARRQRRTGAARLERRFCGLVLLQVLERWTGSDRRVFHPSTARRQQRLEAIVGMVGTRQADAVSDEERVSAHRDRRRLAVE